MRECIPLAGFCSVPQRGCQMGWCLCSRPHRCSLHGWVDLWHDILGIYLGIGDIIHRDIHLVIFHALKVGGVFRPFTDTCTFHIRLLSSNLKIKLIYYLVNFLIFLCYLS